ncbi:MAG: MFS transporter [Solirubrobacteraceae bacterium]
MTATPVAPPSLARRILPLQVAVGLQGIILWVPVEKLFMTHIGFTARSVGVMAAAYAAVVPLFEVPSGILADRWSRNLILVCASAALLASSLVGGLSTSVPIYIAGAMILGIYFALNSGTVDSVVYDVVLEETGSSDDYEAWIGRVRMVESGAFVVSALAGGVLAGWTSPRLTYFASIPFIAVAIFAFLRFDEPRLHRRAEPVALRRHVALMFRTMTSEPGLRQVILLAALVGLLSQTIFEFGPLWLVAFAAPAALFGPYWAALVSTLGVGGYLTSKLNFDRRAPTALIAVAAPASALVLSQTRSLAAVIAAQAVLGLLLAIVAIHAGKLLHDGVPSNVRAGVSSGVGTFSWLLFLPFSLVVGALTRSYGVQAGGWLITGAATLIALVMVRSVLPLAVPADAEPAARAADEFACKQLVEIVTDYLDGVLSPALREDFETHIAACDGCDEYLRQIGATIRALQASHLHQVPTNTH